MNGLIPGFVAVDFWIPVLTTRFRHATMPTAAMPEAAINKNGETLTAKHKIGPARQWLMPAPSRNAGGAKDSDKL